MPIHTASLCWKRCAWSDSCRHHGLKLRPRQTEPDELLPDPNDELLGADVPDPPAVDEHWEEFALSYPGYEVWGQDELGERCNEAQRSWEDGRAAVASLTELRAWLFYGQRRFGYTGWGAISPFVPHLVEGIRASLLKGAATKEPAHMAAAFPSPTGAAEALASEWLTVGYAVPGRFELLETSAMGPRKALIFARRHGRPYLLSPRSEEERWEAVCFANEAEIVDYLLRQASSRDDPRTSRRASLDATEAR